MNSSNVKILISVSLLLSGCKRDIVKNDTPQNEQLVVLRMAYAVPACGGIAFAVAYSFTIDNMDSSFVGVIRCPDLYGNDFFQVGKNTN